MVVCRMLEPWRGSIFIHLFRKKNADAEDENGEGEGEKEKERWE